MSVDTTASECEARAAEAFFSMLSSANRRTSPYSGLIPNGEDSLMDANLLWRILSVGVANQGVLKLPEETATHPDVAAARQFLVEQGWLEERHGTGRFVVTPIGRLWTEQVSRSESLKFYEYGGKTFLLQWWDREVLVWHKGRFATTSIGYVPFPEHFEVRFEMDIVTTLGGYNMENALAIACQLLADDLETPQPKKPELLDAHMFDFLDRL